MPASKVIVFESEHLPEPVACIVSSEFGDDFAWAALNLAKNLDSDYLRSLNPELQARPRKVEEHDTLKEVYKRGMQLIERASTQPVEELIAPKGNCVMMLAFYLLFLSKDFPYQVIAAESRE